MTVIPVVDGVRLSDLTADFERSSGYFPVGECAGLVLQNFEFGPAAKYLIGDVESSTHRLFLQWRRSWTREPGVALHSQKALPHRPSSNWIPETPPSHRS